MAGSDQAVATARQPTAGGASRRTRTTGDNARLRSSKAARHRRTTQPTVRSAIELWLSEGRLTWKASYFSVVAADCTNYFFPRFGAQRLAQLEPLALHAWLNDLLAGGLAPRTVVRLYRELHAALACAMRFGLITANPADLVRPPRVPRTEASFLNREQAQALLRASSGTHLEPLLYLALECGARKGELLALRWSDVDLPRRQFRVRRTAREFVGEGVRYDVPKTYRSARAVSLSPRAVVMLERQRDMVVAMRARVGVRWREHDLVFPSAVGTPLLASNLRRAVNALAARAGLKRFPIHALRHTSASLMADAGVPITVLSAQLGHSLPSITYNLYAHLLPGRQDEAAAAAAEALR